MFIKYLFLLLFVLLFVGLFGTMLSFADLPYFKSQPVFMLLTAYAAPSLILAAAIFVIMLVARTVYFTFTMSKMTEEQRRDFVLRQKAERKKMFGF